MRQIELAADAQNRIANRLPLPNGAAENARAAASRHRPPDHPCARRSTDDTSPDVTMSRCNMLDAPAVFHEFSREPIEQFRMRGSRAVCAEVAGRADQPFAEMILPDAIHHHARGERIRRIHNPLARMSDAGADLPLTMRSSPRSFRENSLVVKRTGTALNAFGPHLVALLRRIAAVETMRRFGLRVESSAVNHCATFASSAIRFSSSARSANNCFAIAARSRPANDTQRRPASFCRDVRSAGHADDAMTRQSFEFVATSIR